MCALSSWPGLIAEYMNVARDGRDGKAQLLRKVVYLQRQPISFAGRPYLPEVYDIIDRNLVLRCSRQTEKSTLLGEHNPVRSLHQAGHPDAVRMPPHRTGACVHRRSPAAIPGTESTYSPHVAGPQDASSQVTNMQFATG